MSFWNRKGDQTDEEGGEPSIVVIRLAGQDDLWGKFSYPVGPGEDVIGRDEACSIQIADPQISRRHLTIDYSHEVGGFIARDMGSVNGTHLNGVRLTKPTVLAEGDVIDLGSSRVVFTSRRIEGQVPAEFLKDYGQGVRSTIPGELIEGAADDCDG